MAEKFGVKEDDFVLVKINEEDKPVFRVAYAGNGIDLGSPRKDYDPKRSWNGIFDKRRAKEFMVEVNGQQVDTRTGMTGSAYHALAAAAKERGVTLPDSPQIAEEHDDLWTWTWLTGEGAGRGSAPIAGVGVGVVGRYRGVRDLDRRLMRFRRAVQV